jgi:serine/threonine protein kinase
MEPNLDRIKEIFALAQGKKTAAEREGYLAEACHGRPDLRREVESLLQAHEQAGEFLNQTIQPPASELVSERAGAMIGRYRLLELIGEGGFGTVWMAEQAEPVRRHVALKVIKSGTDKQVLARFEVERQALAMMNHPSIARVFDGGATDTGRPYFVMELVRGVRITDYCDANKLSMRERLLLFVQICQAVQHAHQKGIIHRDLKPSNILVTEVDGAPVPKVIDFGVAKATQARLTDLTLFTKLHQIIGTPSYMSPEQAALGALDMDTRSDIYALGVLLYELLTGQTPVAREKFEQAGLDEIFRLIREQDPPKPSTRLNGLNREELTTIAARRQVEPVKLNRLLTGDLDWIVMKALEKDRRRRYQTASEMAMDIQRHFQNEPVTACPPGYWYRVRKMVRRNKVPFMVAGAAVAALFIGFGLSSWLYSITPLAMANARPVFLGPMNPGAESGLTGWYNNAVGGGSVSTDNEHPATGLNCFSIGVTNTGSGGTNQADLRSEAFPLGRIGNARGPFTFSFAYKLPDKVKPGDDLDVNFRFFDKDGNFLDQDVINVGSSSHDSAMTRYKTMTVGNIFAPSGAVQADVWIVAGVAEPWTSGCAQFDDFSVTVVPTPSWAGVLVGVAIFAALTALMIWTLYVRHSRKLQFERQG